MTPAIVLLFCILAVMVVLFLTEKLPLDLTAFLGLIALALAGYVSPHEAFSGFSSPVVITMICMFFLSAALRETGTAERMADLVHRVVGNDERRNVLAVMLVASFFSAFMNNIAAAALLLPAVMSIAAKGGISPSLLLMPLSFATLLGGMSTLIGTPPNLLASHSLLEAHLAPLKFLEFLPFGLISILAGSAFFFYVAPRLLPAYKPAPSEGGGKNLAATYRLFERLFTVRLCPGSALVGKSLAELDLGRVLGVQVISIKRDGGDLLAPSPGESVRPSDVLVLGGRSSDLDTLGRFAGIKVQPLSDISPTFLASQLKGAVVEIVALKAPDDTLATVGFHSRFGCLAVAVERGPERYFSNISALSLRPGDRLFVLGAEPDIAKITTDARFHVMQSAIPLARLLKDRLFLMTVPQDWKTGPITLRESLLGKVSGLTVVAILRQQQIVLATNPDEPILAGDQLLACGELANAEKISHLADFELLREEHAPEIESPDVAVIEVVLSPRSKLIGSTLRELSFRERYDFQVLAVWRGSAPVRSRLGRLTLRFGDALLLQGPRSKIALLVDDPDFVVLSEPRPEPRNRRRAPFVIAALGLLVLLPVLGLQTVEMSAFMAAVLVVLSGAVKLQQAYREVEWRVVFFVAALMPLGAAMEHSGASAYTAQQLFSMTQNLGPVAALACLTLAASLVSQLLDSTVAAILLAPVAIQVASQLAIPAQPLVISVALGASVAFMTPFSHKANLLVVGAGGYRTADFLRLGTPLTIIIFVALIASLSLWYGL